MSSGQFTRAVARCVGPSSVAVVMSGLIVLMTAGAFAGQVAPFPRGGLGTEPAPGATRPVAQEDAVPQQGEADRGASERRTFDGRVIGPDGGTVSGLEVLLHRVSNQGGDQLARGVTAEDGGFTLQYEPPSDTEGVIFVAARYDGRAYVGPMLRPPFQDVGDYVMQVGVPGVGDVEALARARGNPAQGSSAPATSAFPAGRSPSGAVFVAMMLTAAIAVGAWLAVRGTGPSRRRRALIGLAELDEGSVNGPPPADILRRRRELLRRASDV